MSNQETPVLPSTDAKVESELTSKFSVSESKLDQLSELLAQVPSSGSFESVRLTRQIAALAKEIFTNADEVSSESPGQISSPAVLTGQ